MWFVVIFFALKTNLLTKQKRKTMKKNNYVAPELELIELAVEAGFAASFDGDQTPTYGEEELPETY